MHIQNNFWKLIIQTKNLNLAKILICLKNKKKTQVRFIMAKILSRTRRVNNYLNKLNIFNIMWKNIKIYGKFDFLISKINILANIVYIKNN